MTMVQPSLLLSAVFFFASFTGVYSSSAIEENCDYRIKVHPQIPDGVGVFANRNISKFEVIDRCISVLVPKELVTGLLIDKYIYSTEISDRTDKEYVVLSLGMCMMWNHHFSDANVKVYHPSDMFPHNPDPRAPAGAVTFNVIARQDITEGDEILSNYGYDPTYWSSGIKHPYIDVTQLGKKQEQEQVRDQEDEISLYRAETKPTATAATLPGCHQLMTQIVGGKVYATQFIEEGELVELSRALLVTPAFAAEPNLTRYVWMEENSDFDSGLGMVILGHGALYSAASNLNNSASGGVTAEDDAEKAYNLRYKWYTHDEPKASIYYWDDFLVDEKAMVSFVATRFIEVNEELIVPLKVDKRTGLRNAYNSMLPRRSRTG